MGKITCMVAEDYQPLNEIFVNLLDYEKDIEVIDYGFSGYEIYRKIQNRQPNILLIDLEMETQYAGIEYAKKIHDEFPAIKIIMLTCHDQKKLILKAYEAGVMDYVLKDNSSAEILEAVRAAYRGDSPIRPYAATAIRENIVDMENLKKSLFTIYYKLSLLTHCELEILNDVMQGKKQKEIAKERYVELSTVKYHISNILKKFECKKTKEVVQLLRDLGIEEMLYHFAQKK